MKKLIIFTLFLSNYVFGQSVTLEPTNPNKILALTKTGIGLDHRSLNSLVGLGTFAGTSGGYIQTHTNYPLSFATNNSTSQMTLLSNGNFGIGIINPTQKLHVVGNAYFTGNFNSTGAATANTVEIGGGMPIIKFMELSLFGQSITALNANTCNTQQYTATGLALGDAVIVNLEGVSTTNLAVANVRAYADLLEVKYCNLGNTSTAAQVANLKVAVIR
jgi:hypothetical protein